MEEGVLRLTETELRYFGDLFLCCDEQRLGSAPLLKATELLRAAGLSDRVLRQITELCFAAADGGAGGGGVDRRQFFAALKLVAAHQANVPLAPDLLTRPLDVPLPRFAWTADEPQMAQQQQQQQAARHHRTGSSNKPFAAYEPIARLSSTSSDAEAAGGGGAKEPGRQSGRETAEQSTDDEVESETTVSHNSDAMRPKNGSPWSTGSESPTPTNSVAEQRAQGLLGPHGRGHWPPAPIGEEHTQLLGTEEESSDRHSSDDDGGELDADGSLRRSVWKVSPEQRLHYVSQFHLLQPDTNGLIPGKVARRFFEKSRLPMTDLHKIWLLSDITKDGALCIEEFITAMHLIVLRRKEIPVPTMLPACLVPKLHRSSPQASSPEQVVTTNLVDLGSCSNISGSVSDEFNSKLGGASSSAPAAKPNAGDNFEGKYLISINPDDSPPSINSPIASEGGGGGGLHKAKPDNLSGNKEWTKFIDSPTSSISSPGPKPVNFDFQKSAVEKDPKIFHPVPLRVTPEAAAASSLPAQPPDSSGGTSPRKMDDAMYAYDAYDVASPKKLSAQLSCDMASLPSMQASEFKPIQRPQAKKAVMKSIGAIPPPPTKEAPPPLPDESSGPMSLQYAPKKDPPPPPPPRPVRTHTRSSSLDLNRLKGSHAAAVPNNNSNNNGNVPPQVPPRVSPSLASPQSKKLINQRSEGDVLGLVNEPFESTNPHGGEEASFANFDRFQNELPPVPPPNLPRAARASFDDNDGLPRKHGAFEVYRKPTPRSSESPDSSNPVVADASRGGDESLRSLQEQNSLLGRLCHELSLELADVQREREALRVRLESGSAVI